MTAPSIREAVARAICCEMSRQPRTDTRPEKPGVCYCKPEEMADLCPENFRYADAALAVALPILQSHFEGVAHSVAHDSLEGSTHREYFNKGVEAAAAAIRADEGPK